MWSSDSIISLSPCIVNAELFPAAVLWQDTLSVKQSLLMDLITKLSVSPLCSHTLFSNAPVRPPAHNVESSQHLEGNTTITNTNNDLEVCQPLTEGRCFCYIYRTLNDCYKEKKMSHKVRIHFVLKGCELIPTAESICISCVNFIESWNKTTKKNCKNI